MIGFMFMNFAFALPPFEPRSAGNRICYHLAMMIEKLGHRVAINTAGAGPDDIAVYPDFIRGNPLGARRVVRYMLYFADGFFGGDKIPADELAIVYHPLYAESVRRVYAGELGEPIFYPFIEPGLFYPEAKTIENLVYTGKLTCGAFPNIYPRRIVTRDLFTREQAAALLRASVNFYTMDHYTAMASEAVLCGCRVFKVLGRDSFEELHPETPELMTDSNCEPLAFEFVERCQKFFGL